MGATAKFIVPNASKCAANLGHLEVNFSTRGRCGQVEVFAAHPDLPGMVVDLDPMEFAAMCRHFLAVYDSVVANGSFED